MFDNSYYEDLYRRSKSICIFRDLTSVYADSCISNLIQALNATDGMFLNLYSDSVARLYEHGDNLTEYIVNTVLDDENAYVKAVAKGTATPLMEKALYNELEFFQELATLQSDELIKSKVKDVECAQWATSKIDLKALYIEKLNNIKTTGYGIFAKHKMFIGKDGEIVPVKYPDPQRLSEMSGYELERQKVIDNTLALLDGKPCNNVLLYGDAGSGKSSTIKAIVNEYWDRGLRLVEIQKSQLYYLPDIIEKLADNPLKFIIFIDDLSFSANDSDFGALKAILEGGVAGKTKNIAIYATSNRRNLVKENFADRNGDDLHREDTIQEVTSLSARFGLKVTFSKPNKDLYLSIVQNLAIQYNIDMDVAVLSQEAEAFAIRNGGRSPRTAKQFIEYLASK